jgi:peroxiredoxin
MRGAAAFIVERIPRKLTDFCDKNALYMIDLARFLIFRTRTESAPGKTGDSPAMTFPVAPPLAVSRWFNSPSPITLDSLRGRVVMLHAFQMLCPGCVAHGTPQAQRAHGLFKSAGLVVIGLHTVFEHHAAMTPVSLEAFIHEYRLSFPIGVDEASVDSPIPVTMQRYEMRGTPTAILIGRDGTVRRHSFGQEDDLALGAIIGSLLAESP